MKKAYIATVLLFFVLLSVPLATFEWREDVISEIDNRRLTASPLTAESLSQALEQTQNYVSDRIGLRNAMIRLYTQGHDLLFGEMVHPSYQYGQDGYVFFRGNGSRSAMTDYDYAFVNLVEQLYTYCRERDIPFLFLFDPAKQSVYYEKLHPGIRYQNGWVEQFTALLAEKGIPYVDNTAVMRELAAQGVNVFNRQYDAGHWNDIGAFYGTNAALTELKKQLPSVHVNDLNEFEQTSSIATSLPGSEFPIEEEVPWLTANTEITDLSTSISAEMQVDSSFPICFHTVNQSRQQEGAPTALVFQGSYYNGYGWKFFANSFGEYHAIHDYQNILNFEYYYNLFRPDCVIFEVAEYTFDSMYFDYQGMLDFDLAPLPEDVQPVQAQVTVTAGQDITTATVTGLPDGTEYAYLRTGDTVYDLARGEDGSWTLSLFNENWPDSFEILA